MTEVTDEPGAAVEVARMEIASTIVHLEQAGALTPISLDLYVADANMEYDTWESFGRWLGSFSKAATFWIGDWLIFGETLYGEDSAQAVEATASERYSVTERITGLAHQTLLNSSSVCRRVARERRREELSFGHHSVVAPLEDAEQSAWLQKALDNGWSVSALREAIRQDKSPVAAEGGDVDGGGGSADGPSISERIEAAAAAVYTEAQATDHGVHEVPDPTIHLLGTALGRE